MSALIPQNHPEMKTKTQESPLEMQQTKPKNNQTESAKSSILKFLLSLAIAAVADGMQLLVPPMWIPIDVVAALIFFALWGFRWEVALALVPELTPGVDLFPTWIALAIYLGGRAKGQSNNEIQAKP